MLSYIAITFQSINFHINWKNWNLPENSVVQSLLKCKIIISKEQSAIITSVERAAIGLLLVVGRGASSMISSTGAGSWTRCGLPLPLLAVLSSPFSSFGVTPKNRTGPLGNTWGNSGPSWWVRKLLESTRSKPGLGRFPRVLVGSVVPVLWFDRDLSMNEFNSYITRIEAAEGSEMEEEEEEKCYVWCAPWWESGVGR